ncbi:MAG: hypothetical protein JWM56_41 [Candidatus Peribacteria bacterium]|nr:hypothetical protein [Candidatus Peribacteria bacterium]
MEDTIIDTEETPVVPAAEETTPAAEESEAA